MGQSKQPFLGPFWPAADPLCLDLGSKRREELPVVRGVHVLGLGFRRVFQRQVCSSLDSNFFLSIPVYRMDPSLCISRQELLRCRAYRYGVPDLLDMFLHGHSGRV